jgi:hypothetical protein
MELAQLTGFSSRSQTGPYLTIVHQPNDGDQRTFQKPVTVRCENASALPARDVVCVAQLFLCGQSKKDATLDSDGSVLAYFSPPAEIASSLGGAASLPVTAHHPVSEFSDLKVHMTTSQMRKRCKFVRHQSIPRALACDQHAPSSRTSSIADSATLGAGLSGTRS